MISLVILDFDGTFTDATEEARPFVASYRADVADLLGRDIDAAWEEEQIWVEARPGEHGWLQGGVITAPAGADPYITAACVAQRLCDRFGVLTNDATRSEVLQALYRKSYPLTAHVPRPDAAAVLAALLARGTPLAVVSNSRTDAVRDKVAALGVPGSDAIEIVGDARKFVLDRSPRDTVFDALVDLPLPGLEGRKVAVQRGHYYDVLCRLWRAHGASAETTLVCGDVFELDLALPLSLGAHVHLVHHARTPRHELDFLRAHPRAGASLTLSGVLGRV